MKQNTLQLNHVFIPVQSYLKITEDRVALRVQRCVLGNSIQYYHPMHKVHPEQQFSEIIQRRLAEKRP